MDIGNKSILLRNPKAQIAKGFSGRSTGPRFNGVIRAPRHYTTKEPDWDDFTRDELLVARGLAKTQATTDSAFKAILGRIDKALRKKKRNG